jgi:organic radical activating enzyme
MESNMENSLNETQNIKSIFLTSATKMQKELGPALCLAKWKQVSLHLPTGLNNSCYHPPLHSIPIEGLADNPGQLHNTPHKKAQRVLMLQNERPSECQYCWNMEDLSEMSDRHYRSGEPWAAVDLEKIKTSTGTEDDVVPSYVEVNFNHACNLKCSYCSPQFSSSWQSEVDQLGAYPTSTPHNDPKHFVGNRRPIPVREDNPYVDAFWAWWPKLYPQLKHFRMTGGEPLMDKNTYRVFDYVLALPKPDLHLNVTSNFSVEDVLFEKYLGYVKQLCNTNIEHFMQYVSLDTGNFAQAEYIRHGLDSARLIDNVLRYLDEVPARNSLTFIITMNNLSVTGLQSLMEWILILRKTFSETYQRVWFDTPVLRTPAWQSLQILPESYAYQLEKTADFMEANLETSADPFNGFKDYEVQRLRRDIAWMREGQQQDNTQAQADFYRFFSEHDRRRGTDFLQTFPEMRSWWAECMHWSN